MALLSCTSSEGTGPFDGLSLVVLTVEAEGTPVAGVSVALGSRTLPTDASGVATFSDVPVGSYSVNVVDSPVGVVFPTGGGSLNVDRSLVQRRITGEYVRTSAITGVALGAGAPLTGLVVTLAGSGSGSMITSSDGGFGFQSLRAGEYTLSVSGWDPARFTFANPVVTLSLGVGETLHTEIRATDVEGSIRATVRSSGAPQPGVGVRAIGASGEYVGATDVAGQALLGPMPVGPYRVEITNAPSGSTPTPASVSIEVVRGVTHDVALALNLGPPTTGTIEGRVTAESEPVVDATITLSGSATHVLQTDADGRYVATGLDPGVWRVSLSGFDESRYRFSGTSILYTVAAGQLATVDFGGLLLGGPLQLIPSTLPTARPGESYAAGLGVVGGDGDYAWSVSAGSLPNGLRLTQDGVIQGAADQPGDRDVTIRVESNGESAEEDFLVRVAVTSGPTGWLDVETSAGGSATFHVGFDEYRIEVVDDSGAGVAGARVGYIPLFSGRRILTVESPSGEFRPAVVLNFPMDLTNPRVPLAGPTATTIPLDQSSSIEPSPGAVKHQLPLITLARQQDFDSRRIPLTQGVSAVPSSYYSTHYSLMRCNTLGGIAKGITPEASPRFDAPSVGEILLWDSPEQFERFTFDESFGDRPEAEILGDLIRLVETRLGMTGLDATSDVSMLWEFAGMSWRADVNPFSFETWLLVSMDPTDPICRGLVPTSRHLINPANEVFADTLITGARLHGPNSRPVAGVPVSYRTDDGVMRAEGDSGPGTTELTVVTDSAGEARFVWEFSEGFGSQSVQVDVDWAVDEASFTDSWSITTERIPEPAVGRVVVDPRILNLSPGDDASIAAEVLSHDNDPLPYDIVWASPDPSVAQVDQSGHLTALGPGFIEVTATSRGTVGRTLVSVTAGGVNWGPECSGGFSGVLEPNDCPSEATSIQDTNLDDFLYSPAVSSTVSSLEDRDYFYFEWATASDVCFNLEGDVPALHWRLFQDNGVLLLDGGRLTFGREFCHLNVPAGNWTIELTDTLDDGVAPEYSISGRVRERAPISGLVDADDDTRDKARLLVAGPPFYESINPVGDEDWYRIDVAPGTFVCVRYEVPFASPRVQGTFYHADGTVFHRSEIAGCLGAEFVGTKYLRMIATPGVTRILGSYRMEVTVEPLPPPGG